MFSTDQREAIAGLSKVRNLVSTKRIMSGRSNADVYIVDVEPTEDCGPRGLHILKCNSRSAAREESKRHDKAFRTAMQRTMPLRVDSTQGATKGKPVAMLYSLAQGTLAGAAPLSIVIEEDSKQAVQQIGEVAKILFGWDRHAPPDHALPFELVSKMLGSLLTSKTSGIIQVAQHEFQIGSEYSLLRFEGDSSVLPNPIAYVQRQDLWQSDRKLAWPKGHLHGDLHTGNIICRKSDAEMDPTFIDFAMYRADGLWFFDVAYLEFDILLNVLPPDNDGLRKTWLRLAKALSAGINDLDLTHDHRTEGAQALLKPLRGCIAQAMVELYRAEDFCIVFHLAAMAACLNFFRKLDDNPSARKVALLLAAQHLNTALHRLDLQPESAQGSYEVPWLGDASARAIPFSQVAHNTPKSKIAEVGYDVPQRFETSKYSIDEEDGRHARGMAILYTTLREKFGIDSEEVLDYCGYRNHLREIRDDKRRNISLSSQALERESRVKRELEKLSLQHLSMTLAEASKPATEDSEHCKKELISKIRKCEDKINQLENKQIIQRSSENSSARLARQIRQIYFRIQELRAQLRDLNADVPHLACFDVTRKLSPTLPEYREGQTVSVDVTLRNTGRSGASLEYRESVQGLVEIANSDALSLREYVAPGETTTLQYNIRFTKASEVVLCRERLQYDGQRSSLDHEIPTVIPVRESRESKLVASRFYEHVPDGLKIIVQLKNEGEKTASQITLDEEYQLEGKNHTHTETFQWESLDGGQESQKEYLVNESDPNRIFFPRPATLNYCNDRQNSKSVILGTTISPVQHCPSDHAEMFGRDHEIECIDRLLTEFRNPSDSKISLLFIQGPEGLGKTRLVRYIQESAAKHGMQCCVCDATRSRWLHQLVLQVLDFPDAEDDSQLQQGLISLLPGESNEIPRKVLFQFLRDAGGKADDYDEASLPAHILSILSRLARELPFVLVFENLHRVSDVIQRSTIESLLQMAQSTSTSGLFVCATFRPIDDKVPQIIQDVDPPRDLHKKLILKTLDEDQTRELVNSMVAEFPQLSDNLQSLIFSWSGGTPFFVEEYVRALLSPEAEYLQRTGGQWVLKPNLNWDVRVPRPIQEMILGRVGSELQDDAELLRFLAVIGVELPLDLVESIVDELGLSGSEEMLPDQLKRLVTTGFLANEVHGTYVFRHEIKRQVLYESLQDAGQRKWHGKIAEALMRSNVSISKNDYACHLARHLAHSPNKLRSKHADKIIQGAKVLFQRGEFSQSRECFVAAIEQLDGEPLRQVELHCELARLEEKSGKLNEAEKELSRAKFLLAEQILTSRDMRRKSRDWKARVNKELGHLCLDKNQIQEAKTLLTSASRKLGGAFYLLKYPLNGDEKLLKDLAEVYVDLAEIRLRRKSRWLWHWSFFWANRFAKKHDRLTRSDPPLMQLVGIEIAKLLHSDGQLNKAIEEYQRVLDRAESRNDRHSTERAQLQLATIYFEQGEVEQAESLYQMALATQQQIGDVWGLARSLEGLAKILIKKHDPAKAQAFLTRACGHLRLTGDKHTLQECLIELCEVLINNGKLNKAALCWREAKPIVLANKLGSFQSGERSSMRLGRDRLEGLLRICEVIVDYYHQNEQWDDEYEGLKDIENIEYNLFMGSESREHRGLRKLVLAQCCVRTEQRWSEALSFFLEAEELILDAAARGEVQEGLGDVYASGQVLTPMPFENKNIGIWSDPVRDKYIQAARHFVDGNEVRKALLVYDKLLQIAVTQNDGIDWLPYTFGEVVQSRALDDEFHRCLFDRTREFLLERQDFSIAADVHVSAVWAAIRSGDTEIHNNHATLVEYLRRSEELYRLQRDNTTLIDGLNTLIPAFGRLQLWEEVVRCFRELFTLCAQEGEVDEFLEACDAIIVFRDRIPKAERNNFARLAVERSQQMSPSEIGQQRIWLRIAQLLYSASNQDDDERVRKFFHIQALKYCRRVIRRGNDGSDLVGSALNSAGIIYIHREQFDLAEEAFLKSLEIDYSLTTLANRASLYADPKVARINDAQADLEEAYDLSTERLNKWLDRREHSGGEARNRYELTIMYDQLRHAISATIQYARFLLSGCDDIRLAREVTDKAIEMSQLLNDDRSIRLVKQTEAHVLLNEGKLRAEEDKSDSQALELFDRAKAILEEIDDKSGMFEVEFFRLLLTDPDQLMQSSIAAYIGTDANAPDENSGEASS